MSNSSLVVHTRLSPNTWGKRTHAIDTLTIHCVVGQCTAESLGNVFAKDSRNASANYGVDKDGRVGLYVDESKASQCSSNKANDERAITIEVASDTTDPYAVTSAAYNGLITLCTDICKRHGKRLVWIPDKRQALNYAPKSNEMKMTVHRWFANKACPGDYLFNRMGQIANEVNSRVANTSTVKANDTVDSNLPYDLPNLPFQVKIKIPNLNYRVRPSMNAQVVGQLEQTVYTVTEVKDGWGKLKSGAGWFWLCNDNYCEIQNDSTEPAPTDMFQVRVEVGNLNIRSGPSVTYPKFGDYIHKGIYTIIKVEQGNGSQTGWGKLKSGYGWISLDHVKRI